MENQVKVQRIEDAPDIFGIPLLQEILGKPYRSCVELCNMPGFPSKKIGRSWKISRLGLTRWVEKNFSCGE